MIVSLGEEEAAAISAPFLASLLEPLRGAQQRGLLACLGRTSQKLNTVQGPLTP